MTAPIADEADALREGIARGYLTGTDAIEWARLAVIQGEDDRAPLLADLVRIDDQATASILRILGQLAWGADPENVGRIAAAHLHQRLDDGRLEAFAVAQLIHQLLRDGYAPDAGFEVGVRRFDEEVRIWDPRLPAPPAVRAAILEFLEPYRYPPEPGEDPDEAIDQVTVTVEREVKGGLELAVAIRWQAWSGAVRTTVSRDSLAEFLPKVREFAAHAATAVRFEAGDGRKLGRVGLTIEEHGRARRAIVGVDLESEKHPARARERIQIIVPTEHAFLGDFAADLAQLVAVRSGVATLRLVKRWPDEP